MKTPEDRLRQYIKEQDLDLKKLSRVLPGISYPQVHTPIHRNRFLTDFQQALNNHFTDIDWNWIIKGEKEETLTALNKENRNQKIKEIIKLAKELT